MVRIAVAANHAGGNSPNHCQWMLSPSENLFLKKGLSSSHCIFNSNSPRSVFITNLSDHDTWLPKGTCIGKLEIAQIAFPKEAETMDKFGFDASSPEIQLTKDDIKRQINPHLSEEQMKTTLETLWERIRVFAQNDLELGRCKYTTF
jgi:hypothetical protein